MSAAELLYAQFLMAIGEFDLAQQHIRHYVVVTSQQCSMISVARLLPVAAIDPSTQYVHGGVNARVAVKSDMVFVGDTDGTLHVFEE